MNTPNYRNPLEAQCAAALGAAYGYETTKLTYTLTCSYLPDFIDPVTKKIVEVKGLFDAADRRKMLAVQKAHPDYEIQIWFANPERTIAKGSATTYRAWCDKNGFIAKQAPKPSRRKVS